MSEKSDIIAQYLREGRTYSEICDLVHCSMNTISKVKRTMDTAEAFNIQSKPPKIQLKLEDTPAIKQMIQSIDGKKVFCPAFTTEEIHELYRMFEIVKKHTPRGDLPRVRALCIDILLRMNESVCR